MLNEHLIAKTAAKANDCNIVFWKNYRITLLNDRLVRIEQSNNAKFRDDATQIVWFRYFDSIKYEFKDFGNYAELYTDGFVLSIQENRNDCRINVGNGFIPVNNDGNLKGTYRTLDGCNGNVMANPELPFSKCPLNGEISLDDGVCSLTGIAVLDDSQSLTLTTDGKIIGEKADGTDEYVFAYGNDYRNAVKALFDICGKAPLLPRFALGNWWSRYHKYTQEEYLGLMAKFERNGVPLTVATIDIDWHYTDYDEIVEKFKLKELNRLNEKYTTKCIDELLGWTGYTWNERLFPNYKEMFAELKRRNLKTVLNLHPAQGVRFWEKSYKEMANALGKNAETGEVIPFDFTDDDYINAYFSILHKPYENDGVDFWWIDWQQGMESKTSGLDPLWVLNHYHYFDHAKNHSCALILSRYAGIGSHRYPIGFSGDTYMTWKTLEYLPYFTATASNVGYGWWSHDIGGHYHGEKDDELYLRSIQFGVFSPINRLHCSPSVTKEPWYYGACGLLAEQFLRIRHSMIPFIYTANRNAYDEGSTVCEPLYYEYKTQNAYDFKNEYLFGGLLVIPVTKKVENDGFARIDAWLPQGTWTDIFTGDVYNISQPDGQKRLLLRNLESIPVLAKAGSAIPYSQDEGNVCKNPKNLKFRIFAGNGAYTLKEDDENGNNTAFTNVEIFENKNATQTIVSVKLSSDGEKYTIPKDRIVTVELFGKTSGNVALTKNSNIIEPEKSYEDYISVKFAYDADSEYVVTFTCENESELNSLKRKLESEILSLQANNDEKYAAYVELAATESVNEFYATLDKSPIAEYVKLRLKEVKS